MGRSRPINTNGFTLVEVLITGTVAIIIGMGITQMIVSQANQLDRLNRSIEVTNYRVFALAALREGGGCTAAATLPSPAPAWTFNDTSPTPIADYTLPAGTVIRENASATAPTLFAEGFRISARYSDLLIDKIKFRDIINQGIPNKYRANLEVSMRPYGADRVLPPITMPVLISTGTVAGTTQKILSCSPSTSGGAGTNSVPKAKQWPDPGAGLGPFTWKVPDNAKMFTLTMVGGGGGGGAGLAPFGGYSCAGNTGTSYSGSGGGSGAAIIESPIEVRSGETLTITIGKGGAGVCSPTDGGNTILVTQAATYTAGGGTAGFNWNNTNYYAGYRGQGGVCGVLPAGVLCTLGNPGQSMHPDCPPNPLGGASVLPLQYPATNNGKGGNSGCSNGGPGTPGFLRLTWWEEG